MTNELSHIDEHGHAVMVDVTGKAQTHRRAEARCRVIHTGDLGSAAPAVLAGARAAGLLGAKQTSALIPLCHPLPLSALEIEFSVSEDAVEIIAVAETYGQTGVEMEALCACGVAALSLVAAVDDTTRNLVIEDLAVWEKAGGRSGHWTRLGQDQAS